MRKFLFFLTVVCTALLYSCNDPEPEDGPIVPPPTPTTHALSLNDVYCIHYANPMFSIKGHYDFFFNAGNIEDPDGMPWLYFHVYQRTNTGLVEGTYSFKEGNLSRVLVFLDMDDLNDYKKNGVNRHPITDATVTLKLSSLNKPDAPIGTPKIWDIHFEGTADNGDIFSADITLNTDVGVTNDTKDPNVVGNGGSGVPVENPAFNLESSEAKNMNITFDQIEWNCQRALDWGMATIKLKKSTPESNGLNYVLYLDYLFAPSADLPKAGTYPMNATDNDDTFYASEGYTSGTHIPSFLATTDGEEFGDVWYLISGSISISYPSEGNIRFEGDLTSYKKSTLHFVYEGPVGERVF